MSKGIEAYEKQLVGITLPKLPGLGEQTDVVVSVNGKTWQIRRGVEVTVPRAVALVLERSLKAAEYAEEYSSLRSQ